MIVRERRDLALLFAGQALSQIGDRVQQLALLWWLLERTGSAASSGLLMAASTLPVVLLGPLAGGVVDRSDRKRLLVLCDLGRGALALLAALLFFTGRFEPWHAPLLAASLSLFTAFFNPALVSSLPLAVKPGEVPEAQAFEQMTRDLSGLLGPAAGGLLVAAFGVPAAVLVNGLSYLAAAAGCAALRLAPAPPPSGAPLLADLAAGVRYVRGERGLPGLLAAFGVLNFLSGPVLFLLPALVMKHLGGGTLALGLLEATLAGGAVATALRLAAAGEAGAPNLAGAVAVSGGAFLLLAASGGLLPAGLALAAVGGTVAAVNVGMTVHFQRVVPDAMKGRFFALVETVAFATFPLSFLAAAPLADLVGPRALFAGAGVAILAWSRMFDIKYIRPVAGDGRIQTGIHLR